MAGEPWELDVLGPLRVRSAGRPLPLGGARQRAVLAALLLAAGRTVPLADLVDAVWDGREPASAVNTLQSYVSRLRGLLSAAGPPHAPHAPREPRAPREPHAPGGPEGPGRPALLAEPGGGYRLAVDPEQVDALRFERLLAEGRARLAEGDAEGARDPLAAALRLWRGPVLGGDAVSARLRWPCERLEELRLAAVEAAAETDLLLGRPQAAVSRLWQPAAEFPLREAPLALLLRALHASGRSAEALALYGRTRVRLAEELGVDPGPGLVAAHRAVLTGESAPPAVPAAARHRPFVPVDFAVPQGLSAARFELRPITIRDVPEDHALVTASRDRLWARYGESWQWPPPGLTEEQDLIQLAWHQQEFTRRTSFAYALTAPGDGRQLGCVYLDPATGGTADAELAYWTADGHGPTLERELAAELDRWLAARWPWRTVARPRHHDPAR
ncbi:GNAT family N-acetyltransferase [Kitasatospora terrestris]|uniref:OmpR/PhoB-type domain-containing protein n=1 Tax=Kitasatospora terrestris TaxID=258051 RepID=A0ABP9EK09_9ACTN